MLSAGQAYWHRGVRPLPRSPHTERVLSETSSTIFLEPGFVLRAFAFLSASVCRTVRAQWQNVRQNVWRLRLLIISDIMPSAVFKLDLVLPHKAAQRHAKRM